MSGSPRILAFDTSAAHCAAALLFGDQLVVAVHKEMGRGQAERLFPMLDEVLNAEGTAWKDLDAIGVGIGPGNFTGVRIAVSAARGLALSLGIPAVGVSGFACLRRLADAEGGRSLALLPAPRDQWLWEATDASGSPEARGLVPSGGLPRHADLVAPAVIGPWAAAMEDAASAGFDDLRVPDQAAATHVSDLAMRIAPAIAVLACERLAAGGDVPRPAPLYIRPADAAPASDPPPVILP